MPRWKGTTTERGYGATHQRERKRQLAMFRPGQLCVRCGQPIWQASVMTVTGQRISLVDLGHTLDRGGYVGLEHRRCNRGDGARRRNIAAGVAKRWASSRRW